MARVMRGSHVASASPKSCLYVYACVQVADGVGGSERGGGGVTCVGKEAKVGVEIDGPGI